MPAPDLHSRSDRPALCWSTFLLTVAAMGVATWSLWRTGVWLGGLRQPSKATDPIRILSGSMAPTLPGPAWSVTCVECAFPFLFDAAFEGDAANPPESICCPNCGKIQSAVEGGAIDRIDHRVRLVAVDAEVKIERGTVVAAIEGCDIGPARYVVKRVMGLPGESLTIINGDIYVDGRLQANSSPTFQRKYVPSVLVHDDYYRPADGSRWRVAKRGGELGRYDRERDWDGYVWIEYCHSPSLPPPFHRGTLTAIKDNVGYNQGLSRSLHDVRDVWMEFRWVPQDQSVLQLEHRSGLRSFRCTINRVDRTATLELDSEPPRVFPLGKISTGESTFTWGVQDGRVALILNGRQVFSSRVGSDLLVYAADEFVGDPCPFAIGIARQGLRSGVVAERWLEKEVRNLRISRDIYYTQPNKDGGPWKSRRLLENEYLLLGDNSPISEDARQGEAGYVKRSAIVGRVLLDEMASRVILRSDSVDTSDGRHESHE